jgi:hypothetical protein
MSKVAPKQLTVALYETGSASSSGAALSVTPNFTGSTSGLFLLIVATASSSNNQAITCTVSVGGTQVGSASGRSSATVIARTPLIGAITVPQLGGADYMSVMYWLTSG